MRRRVSFSKMNTKTTVVQILRRTVRQKKRHAANARHQQDVPCDGPGSPKFVSKACWITFLFPYDRSSLCTLIGFKEIGWVEDVVNDGMNGSWGDLLCLHFHFGRWDKKEKVKGERSRRIVLVTDGETIWTCDDLSERNFGWTIPLRGTVYHTSRVVRMLLLNEICLGDWAVLKEPNKEWRTNLAC